jgi:hypothetical protein
MELDVFLAIYWVPHPVGNIAGPRVHGGDLRRCTIFKLQVWEFKSSNKLTFSHALPNSLM